MLEAYLEDESSVTPEHDQARAARRRRSPTRSRRCCSARAFKNKGVQPLLDAVIDYLPSPLDVPPIQGIDPKTEAELDARAVARRAVLGARVQGDVRPVRRQAHVLPRLLSGKLKAGDRVLNTTTGKTERIGRILQMHANHREERDEIGAGEIAAGVGLKSTTTGDTLVDRDRRRSCSSR